MRNLGVWHPITVDDVGHLENAGWSPALAILVHRLREARLGCRPTLDELVRWADSGLPVDLVLTYARAGLPLDQVGLAEQARRTAAANGVDWEPPLDVVVEPWEGAFLNRLIEDVRAERQPASLWSRRILSDQRVDRTRKASISPEIAALLEDAALAWPGSSTVFEQPIPSSVPDWPWSSFTDPTTGWIPNSLPEELAVPPDMGFHDRPGLRLQAIEAYLDANIKLLDPDEYFEILWPPRPVFDGEGSTWDPELDEYDEHGIDYDDDCEGCAAIDQEPEQPYDPATWQWYLDARRHRWVDEDEDGAPGRVAHDGDDDVFLDAGGGRAHEWLWFETEMHPHGVLYCEMSPPGNSWIDAGLDLLREG